MARARRWHPSQEDDQWVFAVCDRFLTQLGRQYGTPTGDGHEKRRGAAAAVAKWLKEEGREDLTRERIYPLFWEAARRNFLLLKPPREEYLAQQIVRRYQLGEYEEFKDRLQVINVRGEESPKHVCHVGADLVLTLVDRLARKGKKRVHIGLGAGYSTMWVAQRLAQRVYSDLKCPDLVLHALTSGGFLVDQPYKAPITYFSYFNGALPKVDYVSLFSETVVSDDEYERVRRNPGVQKSFALAQEIDIVFTSFASATDEDGMLGQFLDIMIREGALPAEALDKLKQAGWIGDVQFRPYSEEGAITRECPVRVVTLFELADLVRLANTPDKYVVLVAGPCGQCGRLKDDALRPLLKNTSLRMWTHLVTDVDTASALLRSEADE